MQSALVNLMTEKQVEIIFPPDCVNGLYVIGTCGTCKWISYKGQLIEKCTLNQPHPELTCIADFGCIHWEEKK